MRHARLALAGAVLLALGLSAHAQPIGTPAVIEEDMGVSISWAGVAGPLCVGTTMEVITGARAGACVPVTTVPCTAANAIKAFDLNKTAEAGAYKIMLPSQDLCMSSTADKATGKASFSLCPCSKTAVSQVFIFTVGAAGTHQIKNKATSMCLDMTQAGNMAGRSVVGSACAAPALRNGKHGQSLKIETTAVDLEKVGIALRVFQLTSPSVGLIFPEDPLGTAPPGRCFQTGTDDEIIAAARNDATGDNEIDLQDCDLALITQEFRVLKIKNKRYSILRGNLCLEVLNTDTNGDGSIDLPRDRFQLNGGEGARVFLNECNAANKFQQWEFFNYEGVWDGVSFQRGKSSDDDESSGDDETELLDPSQLWAIRNSESKQCLDISPDDAPLEEQLIQAPCRKVQDSLAIFASQAFNLKYSPLTVDP